MKKAFLLFTIMTILALSACGSRSGKPAAAPTNSVTDVLQQQMNNGSAAEAAKPTTVPTEESTTAPTEEPTTAPTEEPTTAPTEEPSTEPAEQPTADAAQELDVDLTAMSSTMVYSEVYNMMLEPDGYMGKTVKMRGSFSVYYDDFTEKFYYACLIADAAACCSQGLEFTLAEAGTFPEDYPEIGAEITVIGIFGTYEENGYLYAQLTDAVMV